MLAPAITLQLAKLLERFPGTTLEDLPSGAALVTMPNVTLPTGWSAATTTVRFIVPSGYPGPCPDCFWADLGLTLANGAQPRNSEANKDIPESKIRGVWFSWHVTDGNRNWNPNRDSLLTYAHIILARFSELQ